MFAALTLSITILASLYFIFQLNGTVVSSESKLLQQPQQNQSYIADLTGENNIPPVNTNTTGIVKFITNDHYYKNNEIYYEINLTNINSDVGKVEVHMGKKTEFGPLANSKNITDLVNLFDNGSAYVQVYAYHPDSLSLFGMDSEIRGQIAK